MARLLIYLLLGFCIYAFIDNAKADEDDSGDDEDDDEGDDDDEDDDDDDDDDYACKFLRRDSKQPCNKTYIKEPLRKITGFSIQHNKSFTHCLPEKIDSFTDTTKLTESIVSSPISFT